MQTRAERISTLRKARMAAAWPILRGGFRPFFLAGAAWAVIALFLWLGALLGGLDFPSAADPLSWHRHEMVFGFVGAIIAGFLLAAIPNWTGRFPIAGAPVAWLFALWLAGRVALVWSGAGGLLLAGAIDVAFYLVFALFAGREIVLARNGNLPLVAVVLLLGLANALDYAGMAGRLGDPDLGIRAGIALVVVMIAVVGGRIVPAFTRNWMSRRGWSTGLPAEAGWFDKLALSVGALALLAWVLAPIGRLTGFALAIAAALHLVRLARWRGWRTLADPLVLVLHVGYLWVPLGLALLGLTILEPTVPRTAAVHALTTGAMATMILAVMTRASLGHTGRELKAGPATVGIYVLITLAAILRVSAALGWVGHGLGIEAAGACWAGAFLLFLLAYGPMLSSPRLDDPAR